MRHPWILALSATASLICIAPLSAHAISFTELTVFGDSLSDTGIVFELTGGETPPSPPYFDGRFSNGPVWSEHVAADRGVMLNSFAVGGAETSDVLDQIGLFNGGGGADPGALYVIFAGGNNFLGGVDDPAAAIEGAITDIIMGLSLLAGNGASQFLVLGLPELSLIPNIVGTPAQGPTAGLVDAYNASMRAALAATGLPVTFFDVAEFSRNIVIDPGSFGLSNLTEPCLTETAICDNPDVYAFWDTIHPTAVVHRLLADELLFVLETHVPEPTAVLLVGIVFLAWTARRRLSRA